MLESSDQKGGWVELGGIQSSKIDNEWEEGGTLAEFKEAKILNFSPSFESSFSGRRDRESGEWFCKRRP